MIRGRLWGVGLVLGLVLTGSPHVACADYQSAKAAFANLTDEERISQTLGLIATGDYLGLLDFGFTQHYYRSVMAFESRENLTVDGVVSSTEKVRLDQVANAFFGPLKIEYITHPQSNSLLLVPIGAFDSRSETRRGLAFERNDKSLSLNFVFYPLGDQSFEELYQSFSVNTPRRKVAYERNRQSYFVSNGTFDGRNFYTWMSRLSSGTSGFTLSWTDNEGKLGSKLSILLANAFIPIPRASSPQSPVPGQLETSPQVDLPKSGSGTGFVVSRQGHILTNFHVAGACREIWVKKAASPRIQASLVGSDKNNDLALLQAQLPGFQLIAPFRGEPVPKAGEEIVVFGFPRPDILSETGNVVSGNITALAGIANDSREYQISAPVQPGNSGGPVLDRFGSIVGVVVARLDNEQNVNFSIKSSVAQTFLDSFGITVEKGVAAPVIDTTAIADRAREYTFRVDCMN